MVFDFDAGGHTIINPNYKKGNGQPKYIETTSLAPDMQFGANASNRGFNTARETLFNFDNFTPEQVEALHDYGMTPSRIEGSFENYRNQLTEQQGALSKLSNAIAQAAVSEVVLGTAKGVSDLVDFVSGAVFRSDNDYSNPVSRYLGQLQEDFKNNVAPIYSDPDKNISNGGLLDAGWWASNLPSVMSSLTLMIPSTGITKGLGWLGKSLNAASKCKLAAFGHNTYKALTGAGKVKTAEEAAKLNRVTKWLNDTNTMAAGQRMLETGVNASLMRTMENYQEAHQVYDDMRTQALDKFNNMSDEEYATFVSNNADKLEGVDANDKEAVASTLAKQSADRTFVMDYANTIFDVIQLNALRNPIKLLKNMRSNAKIAAADEASKSAIGNAAKAANAATTEAAEKAGIASSVKSFGKGVGRFLKDLGHTIKDGVSEGFEEAINYIAQEEGMHYGNVALGEDIDNGFNSRLGSYMRSPELYDAAFWGVLGGVVFQGLGSGFNRLSVAAERAYQQKKKKADSKTGEALNYDNFQELFETSENKRRIADINKRTEDFNDLVNRLDQIEGKDGQPGTDPFNTDENDNPIQLTTEIEKTIARERAISEYITGMTFRAMDNGNFDMLKAYLQDTNIRQALEEATGNEGDGGAFIDSLVRRMDHIAEAYSNNLIALSNVARNVNIASESAIPVEYLQIIARDNTAAQMKLEDIDSRIATYELSAENKKAVYGNKLDKNLNYKDAVQLVVLTQQLAQLRAQYKQLSDDKSKQGIGRQIELDRLKKNIAIVEDMIKGTEEPFGVDALSRLLYSTVISDRMNDRAAYNDDIAAIASGDIDSILGEGTSKKFELTDEKLTRVLGADRASGSYKVLATDIDDAFDGAYGLNKIDTRLGDDYTVLATLNLQKAILNEDVVMNEEGLQKKVNELHNDMLDARKKAIGDAETMIRDLAKTYGRQEMLDYLETGDGITWNNEADKKKFDDALEILNLTSASNRRLYDNLSYMILKDELVEISQEAANPTDSTTGENSSTVQNSDSEVQVQSSNNQSQENEQTAIGQENPLNEEQIDESSQGQEQNQNIDNVTKAIIRSISKPNKVLGGVSSYVKNAALNEILDNINAGKQKIEELKREADNVRTQFAGQNGSEEAVRGILAQIGVLDDGLMELELAAFILQNDENTIRNTLSNVNVQNKEALNRNIDELIRIKQSINSSTGGENSNSSSPARDDNGNLIPDAQREAVKAEISHEIMNAIKTAKANGTDATEAINAKVQELAAKYGQDEEYKKEINRIAASWHKRAQKQGLAGEAIALVTLATSVEEKGGTFKFTDDYFKQTKEFVDKFLDAVNAKKFNEQTIVASESIIRFCTEQYEDPNVAEYVRDLLQSYFETANKQAKNKKQQNPYIIIDNIKSPNLVERAKLTNKELADQRLGGIDMFRVDIESALEHVPSKRAIDSLEEGATLTASFNDKGDIILLSDDNVEVGRLPKPNIDSSTGSFNKTNDGWVTDVRLNGKTVYSELRKVWEDILLNKTAINDKINTYVYQIIATKRINGDVKTLYDTVDNDSALTEYFKELKKRGIVDDKATNRQLIGGLVSIWSYIDLTSPIEQERKDAITYSLNLWFEKLYDSYQKINEVVTNGLDKYSFNVAKITKGSIIQVAKNNLNGYNDCTLGTENRAIADVENTEIGVIKSENYGVIQTANNKSYFQAGQTGGIWAVFPNKSGVPGIVRGHSLKFLDSDTTDTPSLRIRTVFAKRCYDLIKNLEEEKDLIELFNYLKTALDNRNGNVPLFARLNGNTVSKLVVNYYPDDANGAHIKVTDKSSGFEFVININSRNYYIKENKRTIVNDSIDEPTFKDNFRNKLLGSLIFNADYAFFNSDADTTTPLNGLATRDKDGNFVITIPNGTDTPLIETFKSYKHFMFEGGGARWNTENRDGSNFESKSEDNQLRNQVLNVRIEAASSRPVEELVEDSITQESINNGTAIDALLEKRFGKDSSTINRLRKMGLIPSEINYTKDTLMKGDHTSNIWTSTSKKKIYVNDEFVQLMNNNPDMAIRKLIHEQLHLKLHGKGNRRKELLKRIQEIVNDFETALDNDSSVNPHLREYLFNHIDSNEERLEEFLVESLTNRELASYLNSKKVESPTNKTKQSIFDKILELLADIFDWKVTRGSIYEKELKILQGYTTEEIADSTPSEARVNALETLDGYIAEARSHITFDDDTHTYYVDGEPVDYSVTQYAAEVYGRPDIEGDYSHSSAIGRSMDAMYRDFFIYGDDVINRNYPNLNEARKKQILEDLHRLRSYLDNRFGEGKYTVVTEEFPLAVNAKTEDGNKVIAGTMDMFIVDDEGNFHIFDFKAKNHPIDRKINGKEGDDRRNYGAQQNMYRAMVETINPAFKDKVKSIQLIWMDTFYPKISEVAYFTDDSGQVTVDGTPIEDYTGFGTPHLKENVEDSIISLEMTDNIEGLQIPEMNPINEPFEEEIGEDEVTDTDSDDDLSGFGSSVQESTTPSASQFVESLPLEERVNFNHLLLDGTVSMRCS